MIGKVVQGEYNFTVGNDLLESKTIIVDGMAYVPARLAGESTGYIVKFDETTGVKWIKKITTPKMTVLKSIEVLNNAITRNQNTIIAQQEQLEVLKKEKQTEQVLMDIDASNLTIKKINEDIIGCQEQISKFNQLLSDIDAQELELTQ